MRHLRLALVLLLAFAPPAEGLLSHAARAHRLVGAAVPTDFCIPATDKGVPEHPASCDDHCRVVPSGDAATPPPAGARPVRVAIASGATSVRQAQRVPPRPTFDHAPRAPPAVA
ncbi:hypothetical protein [Phreatobacter cathodiphilus]|uniref:DUF2946 domain-containing protein n=1 Tax=Phreatobacter cathodiphilus TaxID=1868589 RepID=A0A2S0NGV5_9HYPH|nr:hypothetical protein [Phreatobacter cathodiphilus]AVO47392.1 hypothetical protein C6569_21390 [Phreatobacter cathodiphilus]